MERHKQRTKMGVYVEQSPLAKTNGNGLSKVADFPALDGWEEWLVRHGVKRMTGAKTSHTEWSKTVVGLIASIVCLVVILSGAIWWGATLSNELSHTKDDVKELKNIISDMQKIQFEDSIQKAKIDGFKAGVAETQSDKGNK